MPTPPCTNPDPLRHGLLLHPDTHRRSQPAPRPVQPLPRLTAAVCSRGGGAPGRWTRPAPTGTKHTSFLSASCAHAVHRGQGLEENLASGCDSSVPHRLRRGPHSPSVGRPGMGSAAQSLPPRPHRLRDGPGLQRCGVAEAGRAGGAKARRSIHALTVASGDRAPRPWHIAAGTRLPPTQHPPPRVSAPSDAQEVPS